MAGESYCPVQRIMCFLEFTDVSFLPNLSIGKMCEDLNTTVGHGIWYDNFKFKIQSGYGW
jgi:hypothetical protein